MARMDSGMYVVKHNTANNAMATVTIGQPTARKPSWWQQVIAYLTALYR